MPANFKWQSIKALKNLFSIKFEFHDVCSKDEHITQLENTMSKNEALANSWDVKQRMKIQSSEKDK